MAPQRVAVLTGRLKRNSDVVGIGPAAARLRPDVMDLVVAVMLTRRLHVDLLRVTTTSC